jgi:hypothetical protein
MKRIALLLAVMTVAAACSSTDDGAPADTTASVATTQATQTTQASDVSSTPNRDAMEDSGSSLIPDPVIPPDGPPAPDFTMALADGGTFTLSEQAMPVYMIFWADW